MAESRSNTGSPLDLRQAAAPPPADLAGWDELRLVLAARTDGAAFAELYRRERDPILRYVHRRTGDPELAEDITGEVFLAALRTIQRFQPRGIPLRHWLLRIALRILRRHAARAGRGGANIVAPAELVDGGSLRPCDDRDAEAAVVALRRLPMRYQDALTLHYLEGLSVLAVAQVVGCATGTIKARLSRGRDLLRQALAEVLPPVEVRDA